VHIENSFAVTAPPPQVWRLLLDVEQVVLCMPGAELTEVVDDRTWKGRVKMRIGPVSMKYSGTVVMVERDDVSLAVTLRAEGREMSGKGNAAATVRSSVQATGDGGSKVLIDQDLQLSGMAAQFGSRMMQDVSAHLTQQFAERLSARLTLPPGETASLPQTTELPALRLAIWAFLRAIGRVLHLPSSRQGHAAAQSVSDDGQPTTVREGSQ
jgi:carbon monoxide dehydrogenase subunit G